LLAPITAKTITAMLFTLDTQIIFIGMYMHISLHLSNPFVSFKMTHLHQRLRLHHCCLGHILIQCQHMMKVLESWGEKKHTF